MRRLIVLAIVVLCGMQMPVVAAQGDSTPTCTLTPLTLPLFDGTPVAEFATPQASPVTIEPSLEDVTDVLAMYVACTNTGDPTLVWAMFSPRWFSTQFADSETHYLPAFEYEIANGITPVTDPLELVKIDEIEMLPDGRVGVTATFASADMEWTDQLILVSIDGQWFIDDVVLISPAG